MYVLHKGYVRIILYRTPYFSHQFFQTVDNEV